MDLHLGSFLLLGFALLGMTILPLLLTSRPMSLPLVYLVYGWAAFRFTSLFPAVTPLDSELAATAVEIGSEVVVIVSLAVVGLSIKRRPGWTSWSLVWRLLGITMPLSIVAVGLLGFYGLGLGLAGSVLLGAVLAPTDPVLADEVQVPDPDDDEGRNEVRFALTAEAGLNDSLAFPFTHLAISLAAASVSIPGVLLDWALLDVAYRSVAGIAMGLLVGFGLGWLSEQRLGPASTRSNVGLFALGATLVTYGLTELINGYGFLAVFVAALTRTGNESFRTELHEDVEQAESLLVAGALIGVGALVAGGILSPLTPFAIVLGFLTLITRLASGWLALTGSAVEGLERFAISFLGIRGLGTVFYVAYATSHGEFEPDVLAMVWAVSVLTILVSVVVHGITAPLLMNRLDRGQTDLSPAR